MSAAGKGDIIVVSAPSGSGKTTLIRRLLAEIHGMHFSVSHTTRRPRPGEAEGVDYHFVDRTRFEAMIAAGEFLEWAEVHSKRYGTAVAEVDGALGEGEDVLLDVDTQGAASIRKLRPEAVLIFILPPARQALRERIAARGQDDPEQVQKRLEAAGREVAALGMYDYIVVNDSLERALKDLQAIIRARRLRRDRASEQVRSIVRQFEEARPASTS
jgi:guanylate kinase